MLTTHADDAPRDATRPRQSISAKLAGRPPIASFARTLHTDSSRLAAVAVYWLTKSLWLNTARWPLPPFRSRHLLSSILADFTTFYAIY